MLLTWAPVSVWCIAVKKLYSPVWSVAIDDGETKKTFNALDLSFKVTKSADTTPNELEIELYNLNADSRGLIQKLCNIELSAGYQEVNGLIFKGVVEFVGHEKQGTEWVTKVTAKDGAVQWRNTFVNISFAKGTPIDQIIKKLFDKITEPPEIAAKFKAIDTALKGELELVPTKLYPQSPKVSQKPNKTPQPAPTPDKVKAARDRAAAAKQRKENIKLEKAKLVRGSALKKLDLFCKSYGLEAIWDDQTLHVVPIDSGLSGEAQLLSVQSGLIGSPEQIETGLKISSLLRADIKIARFILLESTYYSGVYQITRLEHNGNTRGNEWFTTIEAKPV